jgi:hypothetical protein
MRKPSIPGMRNLTPTRQIGQPQWYQHGPCGAGAESGSERGLIRAEAARSSNAAAAGEERKRTLLYPQITQITQIHDGVHSATIYIIWNIRGSLGLEDPKGRTMKKSKRKAPTSKKAHVLDNLKPDEAATLLRVLLEKHPN